MDQLNSPLLQDLMARQCIKDCTDLEGLDRLLCSGQKFAIYAGFDPTAESLHVGNLLSLSILRRFALAGHTIVPLVGNATAQVGDPSGRATARPLMSDDTLQRNVSGIVSSIRSGLGPLPGGAIEMQMNNDWFASMGWTEFVRMVGSVVPLGKMLGLESVRSRTGADGGGISFLEFSYSLMQGYDFFHLSKVYPHLIQIGGSDQWGNICMGNHITRSLAGEKQVAFGLTHPLLTKANGEKMGKSAGNAVWLDRNLTSDFDFFQFFRSIDDRDFIKLALALSDRDPGSIRNIRTVADLIERKADFAYEMTARIRGEKAAQTCVETSRMLMGSAANDTEGEQISAGPLRIELPSPLPTDLCELLVHHGLCESKSAARRLAVQGGIRVNNIKRTELTVSEADLNHGSFLVSVGRKKHVRFVVAD